MTYRTVTTGLYRHNKSGKVYEVIGTALHTEDDTVLVIYRPQYDAEYGLFARPIEMFSELVVINGQSVPRFEPIESQRNFVV